MECKCERAKKKKQKTRKEFDEEMERENTYMSVPVTLLARPVSAALGFVYIRQEEEEAAVEGVTDCGELRFVCWAPSSLCFSVSLF
jgi:hypothetical protein